MYHFIYKTSSKSGKYYIGRHSTNKIDDGYLGSGNWVKSIKNKENLHREILVFCDDEKCLREQELKYITENIDNPDCMNYNLSSAGFSTGHLNPAHLEKEKLRRSIIFSGDKNPAKRPEVREKMSKSQKLSNNHRNKGMKLSDSARKNMSEARDGLKFSEEGKKKLSESRKRQYECGERVVPTFKGKKHSPETLKKMKQKRQEYWSNKKEKQGF